MAEFDGDVLVVGSGPAGVAAAFPLTGAGLRVVLVDGGELPDAMLPNGEYLALRRRDRSQADWMLGRGDQAPSARGGTSPKFRVPTLEYAFRGFAASNRIEARGLTVVGSLAVGGLSNAWGCGVARFDASDWSGLPVPESEWSEAFAAVAQRAGLSGRADDDLSDYFGVDAHAQAPLPLDPLHVALADGYRKRRASLNALGFRLGRARVAVLVEGTREGRMGCDRLGLCLWGCARGAMYSSRLDLPALQRQANFSHRPGQVVERLVHEPTGWRAEFRSRDGSAGSLRCRHVVLAAGTLASTAIAMRSMPDFTSARLLHLPTAAFALGLPRFLGRGVETGVGFAQLAFALDGDGAGEVSGFTFSTHGLPVGEFIERSPISRVGAADAFRVLLPSMLVGNCFLPSRFSASQVRLTDNGTLRVEGGESALLAPYAEGVRARLAKAFRQAGAWMLPGSFGRGAIGADVHYAATLPMRAHPRRGESSVDGEIDGMPGVFVADGAALPALPSKSHTLAIMANAHRIATRLATRTRQS